MPLLELFDEMINGSTSQCELVGIMGRNQALDPRLASQHAEPLQEGFPGSDKHQPLKNRGQSKSRLSFTTANQGIGMHVPV